MRMRRIVRALVVASLLVGIAGVKLAAASDRPRPIVEPINKGGRLHEGVAALFVRPMGDVPEVVCTGDESGYRCPDKLRPGIHDLVLVNEGAAKHVVRLLRLDASLSERELSARLASGDLEGVSVLQTLTVAPGKSVVAPVRFEDGVYALAVHGQMGTSGGAWMIRLLAVTGAAPSQRGDSLPFV